MQGTVRYWYFPATFRFFCAWSAILALSPRCFYCSSTEIDEAIHFTKSELPWIFALLPYFFGCQWIPAGVSLFISRQNSSVLISTLGYFNTRITIDQGYACVYLRSSEFSFLYLLQNNCKGYLEKEGCHYRPTLRIEGFWGIKVCVFSVQFHLTKYQIMPYHLNLLWRVRKEFAATLEVRKDIGGRLGLLRRHKWFLCSLS